MLAAGYLLADGSDGETPAIPKPILDACTDQASASGPAAQAAVVQLASSVLALLSAELALVVASSAGPGGGGGGGGGGREHRSPLIGETLLWWCGRWAASYLEPPRSLYPLGTLDRAPLLVAAFDPTFSAADAATPAGRQAVAAVAAAAAALTGGGGAPYPGAAGVAGMLVEAAGACVRGKGCHVAEMMRSFCLAPISLTYQCPGLSPCAHTRHTRTHVIFCGCPWQVLPGHAPRAPSRGLRLRLAQGSWQAPGQHPAPVPKGKRPVGAPSGRGIRRVWAPPGASRPQPGPRGYGGGGGGGWGRGGGTQLPRSLRF